MDEQDVRFTANSTDLSGGEPPPAAVHLHQVRIYVRTSVEGVPPARIAAGDHSVLSDPRLVTTHVTGPATTLSLAPSSRSTDAYGCSVTFGATYSKVGILGINVAFLDFAVSAAFACPTSANLVCTAAGEMLIGIPSFFAGGSLGTDGSGRCFLSTTPVILGLLPNVYLVSFQTADTDGNETASPPAIIGIS